MNIQKLLLRKIEKQDLEKELASLNTIGERLHFLRKKYLKLSRAKLSEKIGIEANMLNKYENGYFEPKAERIKEFADFYDIPIEYITGQNADVLLKEDYFLISNLHMYCWEINQGFVEVENRTELVIALYKASKVVVQAIDRLKARDNEFAYIANLFSHDKDAEKILNPLNKDTLLLFFDAKIQELIEHPNIYPHSIERISRIIDFSICTKDALTKQEYIEVINYLSPLIASFKLHSEDKENQ